MHCAIAQGAEYTKVELSSRINMEEAALRRVELVGTNRTVKTLLKIASGLERPY